MHVSTCHDQKESNGKDRNFRRQNDDVNRKPEHSDFLVITTNTLNI